MLGTIHIWFGDDRFLSQGDPERNDAQAADALFDHISLPSQNIHKMPARPDNLSEEELPAIITAAAQSYEKELHTLALHQGLAQFPSFDVHLLGIGGEGHINSLFPHTEALAEQRQAVVAVCDSPKPPAERITLTLPVIQAAQRVWVVAGGVDKAEAILHAVQGTDPIQWPVASARGLHETQWYIDEDAASQLRSTT